jgi:purine-binding chemotaxis protein CheW
VADDNVATAAEEQDSPATLAGRAITFFLNGQRYALPIERVQEIQQIVAFSEVPGGSSGVVGMINLRGHVIPAVDMRRLLGIAPQEYTLDTPMIICRVDGQLVALVADEVQDVVELPEGSIQDAPAMHALSSKMLGVARMDDGLIYLLDLDRLLSAVITSGGW